MNSPVLNPLCLVTPTLESGPPMQTLAPSKPSPVGLRIAVAVMCCAVVMLKAADALSYAGWADVAFSPSVGLADRHPMANPDGDDLLNALEWYTGRDPETKDTVTMDIRRDGDDYVVEFPRAAGLPADVAADIEISADLVRMSVPPSVISMTSSSS